MENFIYFAYGAYVVCGAIAGYFIGNPIVEACRDKKISKLLRAAHADGQIIVNKNYAETKQIADDTLFFRWCNEKKTSLVMFIFIQGKGSSKNTKKGLAGKTKIALIDYDLRSQIPVADNERRLILYTGIEYSINLKRVAGILARSREQRG